jgi:threonine dehydrogenase-like Zn-dependent dehydrogenase
VGEVVEAGPAVRDLRVGQRVVLNPWLSCAPRGIDPVCPACAAGDLSACHHFTDGRLAPGIHTGNSSDATGGFAEYLPAHQSMAIPVPEEVPDEVAVLADPFSVSLHAITRNPPPPGGRVLVYGAGALGTTSTAGPCTPTSRWRRSPGSLPRPRSPRGSAPGCSTPNHATP